MSMFRPTHTPDDGIWTFDLADGHGYVEGYAGANGTGWFCIEADYDTLRTELAGFGFTDLEISAALLNGQTARLGGPCERCGQPRFELRVEHVDDLDAFIIEQITADPSFADGLITAHDTACQERNP